MKEIEEFIGSGIIESFVLGLTSVDETNEVEEKAKLFPEVREAINEFSKSIEAEISANAVEPGETIRPLVLATINYLSRLESGEKPTFPPLLHKGSKIDDYREWLSRPDMFLPEDAKGIHARIIGNTPDLTTAIIWIKESSPVEVHTDEFEKFLIVEGTCTITIGSEEHNLIPGNFLSIPLFKEHKVKVTSEIWCKAILQRQAA